jgi:hypothetical protein
MKKIALLSLVFILCLVLSGCIDIFQHITKDGNGNDRNTIKISISKTLFAMANGFSESDDNIDYEKLFNESSNLDITEYNEFNARVKTINDIMDFGFLIDMNIDYRDRNMVNKINSSNESLIPKYNGKNIIIHLDNIGSNSSPADNAIAAAFYAAAKYRLAISKKCIANIDRVIAKTNEGETEINFLDLYDEYLIEIPILIIFTSDLDITIYSK